LAISKDVHDNIKSDDLVRLREEGHLIEGDERSVIEFIKFINQGGGGVVLGLVVHEPAGTVIVEIIRDLVE
jgi:hypothetical protein